ncbi:hypothetical protein ACNTNF_004112 [Salmonella enterica]
MKKILNPFFLISALVLAVMPLAHSSENGADTIMKIHSAFDYQQTRERLLQAVSYSAAKHLIPNRSCSTSFLNPL